MNKLNMAGLSRFVALLSIMMLLVGLIAGYGVSYSFLKSQENNKTVTITVTETVSISSSPSQMKGSVEIDGSSTVYPITEAIAEEFMRLYPNVRVTVGISGTGGGFKRFVTGETDINDASRPLLKTEAEAATKNGIGWIEIPVAIDGLAVVVNPENNFVDCLTISELREIWKPESSIKYWSDVRPEWPKEPIRLYGPGPDSGTFDFFTERVVGKAKSSRTDYVASEDDNVLVASIESEKYSLGYFGYAYYVNNKDRLKVVAIRDDALPSSKCITPVDENIATFEYPLARPLFIYVNREKFEKKPELKEFVYFYLENADRFVKETHYTPYSDNYYKLALAALRSGISNGLYELTLIKGKDLGPS
ncbi:MAG: PstS family phosphate ABC transporter substrate-binding protein [Nitrososphaerota archaeon]